MIDERSGRRKQVRLWVTLTLGAFGLAALCFRYEIFAAASAPPAAGWLNAGDLFADDEPLKNVPVVTSVRAHADGVTVTVANHGSTTLTYSAVERSFIQLYQEIEEHGDWAPWNVDWVGTGKETYEIDPGEEVSLEVNFWEARRERLLACFSEKGSSRSGLAVLATENPRLTPDVNMAILLGSSAFTAFCIWLAVRIVNRCDRKAKRLLPAMVGFPLLYVASFGPACWWFAEPLRGQPTYGVTLKMAPSLYGPVGSLTERVPRSIGLAINWYATLGIADNEMISCFFEYDHRGVVFMRETDSRE